MNTQLFMRAVVFFVAIVMCGVFSSAGKAQSGSPEIWECHSVGNLLNQKGEPPPLNLVHQEVDDIFMSYPPGTLKLRDMRLVSICVKATPHIENETPSFGLACYDVTKSPVHFAEADAVFELHELQALPPNPYHLLNYGAKVQVTKPKELCFHVRVFKARSN